MKIKQPHGLSDHKSHFSPFLPTKYLSIRVVSMHPHLAYMSIREVPNILSNSILFLST
ncbi:hypothetical protein Scep_018391 [Stephania cephalantha]|uniref:Uncharacterized protein n=1 Tax=Stephania cephalantha TaxID=152367 RepID=A0AAP0NK16_9MAGN